MSGRIPLAGMAVLAILASVPGLAAGAPQHNPGQDPPQYEAACIGGDVMTESPLGASGCVKAGSLDGFVLYGYGIVGVDSITMINVTEQMPLMLFMLFMMSIISIVADMVFIKRKTAGRITSLRKKYDNYQQYNIFKNLSTNNIIMNTQATRIELEAWTKSAEAALEADMETAQTMAIDVKDAWLKAEIDMAQVAHTKSSNRTVKAWRKAANSAKKALIKSASAASEADEITLEGGVDRAIKALETRASEVKALKTKALETEEIKINLINVIKSAKSKIAKAEAANTEVVNVTKALEARLEKAMDMENMEPFIQSTKHNRMPVSCVEVEQHKERDEYAEQFTTLSYEQKREKALNDMEVARIKAEKAIEIAQSNMTKSNHVGQIMERMQSAKEALMNAEALLEELETPMVLAKAIIEPAQMAQALVKAKTEMVDSIEAAREETAKMNMKMMWTGTSQEADELYRLAVILSNREREKFVAYVTDRRQYLYSSFKTLFMMPSTQSNYETKTAAHLDMSDLASVMEPVKAIAIMDVARPQMIELVPEIESLEAVAIDASSAIEAAREEADMAMTDAGVMEAVEAMDPPRKQLAILANEKNENLYKFIVDEEHQNGDDSNQSVSSSSASKSVLFTDTNVWIKYYTLDWSSKKDDKDLHTRIIDLFIKLKHDESIWLISEVEEETHEYFSWHIHNNDSMKKRKDCESYRNKFREVVKMVKKYKKYVESVANDQYHNDMGALFYEIWDDDTKKEKVETWRYIKNKTRSKEDYDPGPPRGNDVKILATAWKYKDEHEGAHVAVISGDNDMGLFADEIREKSGVVVLSLDDLKFKNKRWPDWAQ